MLTKQLSVAVLMPLVYATLPPCCEHNFTLKTQNGLPQCQRLNESSKFEQHLFSSSPANLTNCTEYSVQPILDKFASTEACAYQVVHSKNQKLEFQVRTLQCKGTKSKKQQAVFHLNKCCQKGWKFDFEKRRCVEGGDEDLQRLIKKGESQDWLVSVKYGGFHCKQEAESRAFFSFGPKKKSGQHLVDFEFTSDQIRNFSVFVKPLNRTIKFLDEFAQICIEDSWSTPDNYVIRVCDSENYCNNNFCISKCCSENQDTEMNNCDNLIYFDDANKRRNLKERNYATYLNNNCTIERQNFVNTNWSIDKHGFVEILNRIYRHYEYCLIEDYKNNQEMLVLCNDQEKYQLFIICILLQTSTFLVIPLFIRYIVKSQYKTLYQVYFVLMSVCYFAAVTGITLEKFRIFNFMEFCTYIGYLIIFFTLSSFYWFTMMSCYIMKMFRMKNIEEMTVKNIFKSKVVYLNILNGWSISIVITAIIIVLNVQMEPSALSPNIDSDSCWFAETYSVSNYEFKTAYGELIYYIIPTIVVIMVNVVIITQSSFSFCKMRKKYKTDGTVDDELFTLRRILFVWQLILVIIIGFPWLIVLYWKSLTLGYYSFRI